MRKKAVLLIMLLVAVTIIFLHISSSYFSYNDKFIIGCSYYQVQEKYGEFDLHFGNTAAYKINERWYDKIGRFCFGGEPMEYYFIEFNNDGIAQKAYTGSYPYP